MLTKRAKQIAAAIVFGLMTIAVMAEPADSGCPSLKAVAQENLTPTHKIANSLCTAAMSSPETYSQAVDALWADVGVQMNHEPALPGDGLITREANLKASLARDELSYQLMPDYRLAEVDGKVVGSAFWIFYTRVGTLKNGKVMASPIAGRFLTQEGRITDVRLTIDLSTLSDFIAAQKALMAGQKSQ